MPGSIKIKPTIEMKRGIPFQNHCETPCANSRHGLLNPQDPITTAQLDMAPQLCGTTGVQDDQLPIQALAIGN